VKRFHFPLERLLNAKRQLERLAEQRQQQARAAFEAACAEVARAESRVAEAAGGGLGSLRQSAALGMWQARYEQVAALGKVLAAAQAQARQAEVQLQAASLARARIASEVEALIHLRRQQWQAHVKMAERHRQEQLDEMGTRRWLEARNSTGGSDSSRREEG
jgi:flagellar FliJ protein